MRRIVALIASAAAALGLASAVAVSSPGVASAAPAGACTSTTTMELLRFGPIGNGLWGPIGTDYHYYVGSAFGGLSTYRIWHVHYRPQGAAFGAYDRAYAVRCQPDGTPGSEVDLTRTADQALTPFDQRCGTAAFTVGNTAYTLVGSRSSFGTTWRYWRTTTSTSTLLFWGVTAARCP